MMLGMSWTEIAGFLTGAVSVWLYVRQNVWAWPVGIANSVFWLVLFWTSRLYLDAGLQLVYIGLGVAGWYWWLRGGERPGELPVTRTRRGEAVALTAQYMLTRKLLGNWWCWIAVDLAYIVMYTSQHLYLTAALQPLFIAMCVAGWRRWRASLHN